MFKGLKRLIASVDPSNAQRTGTFNTMYKAPISSTIDESEIHEGKNYFVKTYVTNTIGLGITTYFAFTTPSTTKRIHAKALLAPDVDYTIEIQEGATITGGTTVVGVNNDRDSTNTASLIPVANPTVSTAGTVIWSARNGGGRNPVGVAPGLNYEIVAKTNTTYVFKLLKNINQAGVVDIDFFWSEHIPE
jgi:hypothetical protein